VRAEGRILTNKKASRFMFDDIPTIQRAGRRPTAKRKGWRLCQGDKKRAARPPELLNRDHVRADRARDQGGGGSRHGASISTSPGSRKTFEWRGTNSSGNPEHYTVFKQLRTSISPMEADGSGPTTHYVMGRKSGRCRYPSRGAGRFAEAMRGRRD